VAGLSSLRPVHQPDHGIAGGVAPENVALAVAIEIGGADNGPGGPDIAERGILLDGYAAIGLTGAEQPHRRVAAAIAPEPVVEAVAVEVALAHQRPGRRHRAQAWRADDLRPDHLPDDGGAAAMPPGDVAQAVAVEGVGAGKAAREQPGGAEVGVIVGRAKG